MNWRSHKRAARAPAASAPAQSTALRVALPAAASRALPGAVATVAAVLVLSLAVCTPVSADNPSAKPPVAKEGLTAARPRPLGLSIGAGAGYVPVAKGVNAWKPLLMPHVSLSLGHRVVLGTGGLAIRLVGVPRAARDAGGGAGAPNGSPAVRVSARLIPNLGRYDEHLPEDYDGIGDVPVTAEAGLDVEVRLWKGFEATASIAVDALGRGHGGSYVAAGARWTGTLPRSGLGRSGGDSPARLQCVLAADVVGGTTDYMEAYYAVSEQQAGETTFGTYEAAAGPEAVRAQVTLALPLGDRVTVASETTVMSFIGQARQSPLVRATEQGATQLIVTYRL